MFEFERTITLVDSNSISSSNFANEFSSLKNRKQLDKEYDMGWYYRAPFQKNN